MWWIIFSLTATSLCLAQQKASGQSKVPGILFYGGDFDPNNPNANGLDNENDAIISGVPYGAATLQNFVIGGGTTWNITGLFTNNISGLNPASAYWEIRTGVSEGNGGTLIASGTAKGSDFTQTATGRNGFGLTEFTDMVSGLNLCLASGTYWVAVVPQDPNNANRSFNSNTFGLNSIGTQTSDTQFWNSPFFNANFTNADNQGTYPTFSSGVIGDTGCGTNPSATTLALTGGSNPSTYGAPLTFTATVSGVGGIPTGTVQFEDNGTVIPGCSAVPLVPMGTGSEAICGPISKLPAGTDTLLATYSGDNFFTGSVSPPLNQVVDKANPAFFNLTPSQSITYGTPSITLSGTICAPETICPPMAEQVTITVKGQPPQTALISDNTGDFSDSYPTGMISVGIYTITYSYAGDGNFNAAIDSSTTLTVNQTVATIKVTPYNLTYDGKPHSATGAATCGAIDVSGDLNLSGTTHTNAGLYATDPWTFHDPNGNCKDANGTVADTINPAQTSTALTANPPSPSIFGQTVTFTTTVSGSNGGSPTGTVNFTADNAPIAGCTAVVLIQQQNNSTAVCQTSSLAAGSHTVLAAYGGDNNFKPGSGSLAYTVHPAADFTVQITPGSISVTQGFTNENQPFFPQTINISAQPVGDYRSSVTLSCSVAPPLTGGTCTVNTPTSGSLANGSLNTTLTISAGGSTTIGDYTVTITAQDSNELVHTATLTLTVIDQTSPGSMPSGGAVTLPVSFPGTPNTPVGNFVCSSVTGTGINGTEAFSVIGGVCTFTPGSINLPTPVTVTLSGCSVPVARLQRQSPIFASVFFGLPAVVLLGPLFRSHRKRRKALRVVSIFLLALSFLMLGFGCGGGYGPLTPTGHYYVLVQGTDSGGATYSAVVPLTVVPLNK